MKFNSVLVLFTIIIRSNAAPNEISSCEYSKREHRVTFVCLGYNDERLFYPSSNHFCGDRREINAFNKDKVKAIAFQNCELHQIPRELFEEYNGVQVLNASSLGLKWLYLEEARSIIKLFAPHNRLKMIPEHLGKVIEIDLSHNEIDEIGSKVHSSCNKVKIMDLSFNNIDEVKASTFDVFCELQNLNLSYNRIKEIQPTTFSQLKRLKKLDLSNNDIHFSYDSIILHDSVQLTVTIDKRTKQLRSKDVINADQPLLEIDRNKKNP